MRLWHFPRPNHSFAHLLKYFTSKLKNEEFISILMLKQNGVVFNKLKMFMRNDMMTMGRVKGGVLNTPNY